LTLPDDSKTSQINAVLDRIKEIKGWSGYGSDKLLHEYLGVTKQVLSGWRSRGGLDWERVNSKLTQQEFAFVVTGRKPFGLQPPVLAETQPEYVATVRTEIGPPILPSMVAMAAQMVDEIIEAMPPDRQPKAEKKWEAIARASRLIALDHAEGTEGTARSFLLGLKQEWLEAQTKTEA
jgi:hypothetical protein